MVTVDALRIEQVLLNLLGNALKFTPAGGHVALQVSICSDHVRVEVRDDGGGIPPEAISQLFERFFQVEGTAQRETGGAGLGLAIAKALVEAHQGAIGVESVAGHGVTFWFTLPFDERQKVKGTTETVAP